MEEETKPKRSFKSVLINILIILTLLIISIFMYAKYIGTSGINVKEYLVKSDKIPKSLSGSKIIYFSDLLLGSTTNLDTLKLIAKRINELNPDIVIFGGNLLSDLKYLDNKSDLVSELKNIDASLGKYFVLGDNVNNSEDSRFANMGNILKNEILGKVTYRWLPKQNRGRL